MARENSLQASAFEHQVGAFLAFDPDGLGDCNGLKHQLWQTPEAWRLKPEAAFLVK